jgi:hypothetical protein
MKHILLILLLAFISFNCERNAPDPEPLLPTVITVATTSITANTALSGGNATVAAGPSITARGVCWGTATNPVITGNHTVDGSGNGIFASSITGLTASTTYYVRAYATNNAGTSYGNEISFTTTTSTTALPTVTTTAITAVTMTTAAGGGNVTADGGATITTRGVCWSTTANPTIALSTKTTDGTGIGTFTSAITGLTASTTYHVRAYATNSMGTAYGNDVSFTTSSSTPDVYVGGFGGNGSGDMPTIWKNGVASTLPIAGNTGDVRGVYVSGSDVHAVGFQTVPVISEAGIIWKNGVITSSGINPCGAWWTDGIFVSGSDVYVSGEYDNCTLPGKDVKIWKNGSVLYTLTGGSTEAAAASIYVSGADVYAAGFELDNATSIQSAKLWKNGVAANLSTSTSMFDPEATSVFVSGSDVFVAGFEKTGSKYVAKLWKNGVATSLTNGANDAYAYSVFVSGTDVYVGGYEFNGSVYIGKIWKNGVATSLTSGIQDGYIWSVFVYGVDVYACGSEGSSTNATAKYWKNGVSTNLSTGVGIADAYSIFVK